MDGWCLIQEAVKMIHKNTVTARTLVSYQSDAAAATDSPGRLRPSAALIPHQMPVLDAVGLVCGGAQAGFPVRFVL